MKKHLKHLETVFSHLQTANLKSKLSKCQFLMQHLHYLGHLISEQGIQPLPDKILTSMNLATPKNVDELHHFIGVTSWYRKFIPVFADITKPLKILL